ncbi:hypothetical protein OFV41_004830 [Escherichia coli]|nr:hypothetical protein [Escherichia coli]
MNKSLMRDIFSLSVISSLLLNFPAHTQNNIVNKWNAGEGSDASGDASTAAGVWVTSTEYGATSLISTNSLPVVMLTDIVKNS